MWILQIMPLIAILSLTVGQIEFSEPDCAVHCWDNTKYVSKCLIDDDICLCGEPQYQKSVYQCIYSQCDTAHFASALNHIITKCFGTGNDILFASPPIPNRDELRRREEEYVVGEKLYGSGSALGYPMESARFRTESAYFPTGSVVLPTESANFPTQSVGFATRSAVNPYFPEATTSPSPVYFRRDTTTLPTMVASVPTTMIDPTLPTSTWIERTPQLFTDAGFRLHFTIAVPIAVTLFVLYLTL